MDSTCASTWIAPPLYLSVTEAAKIAGRSERTVRLWCETYGLGDRVHSTGSSPYVICAPLFNCFRDTAQGREEARRYKEDGTRGPRLRFHFSRFEKKE